MSNESSRNIDIKTNQSNVDINIEKSDPRNNSSEDNCEEIKKNCGVCYNIITLLYSAIKILILLIKIICQIVEFYIIILITNIIIEYKIIFICSLIDIKSIILFIIISILSFIFNLIFDYISINLLTIYYFEFLKFSWINYDLLEINMIPAIIKKDNIRKEKKINLCVSFIYNCIIFFCMFGTSQFAKYFFIFVIIFLPIIKFALIFLHIIKHYNNWKGINYDESFKKAIEYKDIYKYPIYISCIIVSFLLIIFQFIFKPLTFDCEEGSILERMNKVKQKNVSLKLLLFCLCLFYHISILILKKESFFGYLFVILIYLFCFPFFFCLRFEPWIFHKNNEILNEGMCFLDYCYSETKIYSKIKFEENIELP